MRSRGPALVAWIRYYSRADLDLMLEAVAFGLGDQDPSYKGAVGVAKVHLDVILVSPTITHDGGVMCENNELNPDLGLGGL